MTDLRKAAEMALEALEDEPKLLVDWLANLKKARETLRQALAQPDADELQKLRKRVEELTELYNLQSQRAMDYAGSFMRSKAELRRLHQICRNVYEVWAGSEGIPIPETCLEGYLLTLIEQMRDEAKEGLK